MPTPPPVDEGPPPTECDAYEQAYARAMACKSLPPASRASIDQAHTDRAASVAEAGLDNPGYDPDSAYERGHREDECQKLEAELFQLTLGVCP